MRKSAILFAVMVPVGLMAGCGSKDGGSGSGGSEEETGISVEDVKQASEALKTIREQTGASKVSEGKSAREIAVTALEALRDTDVETVKSTMDVAMAVNVDEDFIRDQKEEYLSDWDGEIKGIRYRKDQMTGYPQAVVYYADKDEDHIMVHILNRIGSSGERWYSFGGAYGFEEITKEEFEGCPGDTGDIR